MSGAPRRTVLASQWKEAQRLVADEVRRSHGKRARPGNQEGQHKVRDDRIASYYCFPVAGHSKLWWHLHPNLHGNRPRASQ
jgi:hypothetical protein